MSALRCARNVFATSSRAFSQRGASRSLSLARSSIASRSSLVSSSSKISRAFSASARVQGEGTTDVSLAQKLQAELKFEKEEAEEEGAPEFLKQVQEEGIWTINDVAGNDEVALVRKFGNEEIRVVFSIADITGPEYETAAEEEEGGEEGSELPSSNPIHVSISITKSGFNGALNVDASCSDGEFFVDNVSFYNDTKVGTELTAEADWKRRGLYIGPNFQDLEPAVQEEFQAYLEERGINENLALLVPDYARYKEQAEYVRWLESVKRFIEH